VALVFVGLNGSQEGEGHDRSVIDLLEPQESLVKAMIATGKPVAVILASGSAVAINSSAAGATAVLAAWYGGEEAGTAIAETLAGSFSPVVDGTVLPQHPFDPAAPAISKQKSLMIGTNHDETVFMFMNDPSLSVFQLTGATLQERLERELGQDAEIVGKTYKESRPEASPADLYIAITTAAMFWNGSITAAERKCALGGAPAHGQKRSSIRIHTFTSPGRRLHPRRSH